MSDEKKYTLRDMVLAQREAWISGRATDIDDDYARARRDDWQAKAKASYPLPKVTRPRVVTDPHESLVQWRISQAKLEWSSPSRSWVPYLGPHRASEGDRFEFYGISI